MKILTFGTCRVLQLFDKSINDTFLESIHYTNYCNHGGKNAISCTHTIKQVIFILDLILNKKFIEKNNINYYLYQKLSGFIADSKLRLDYIRYCPDYDINNSISNINSEMNAIKYIILEVCTLKELIINGIPLFLDYNDAKKFIKITDKEFNNDFYNLVNLIKTINKNIHIIFISHIISFNNVIIPEGKHILDLLKINSQKYTNCHIICPDDYILNDDLQDARHYKPTSRYKILNAIKNKVLEIEKIINL